MRNSKISNKLLSAHTCELLKTSNSNLVKLPPNANILLRYKRNFQKLIIVWDKHPLTRYFLRSRATIALEKLDHGRSSNWWIIHPCSIFRYTWELIMTFTFLYFFILVPHILTYHRIARNSKAESWFIVYPANVICLIDIFLNFITGFVSHDGHKIFLNPDLVARRYVKGYFFVDLVSSIQYTWFYKPHLLPPGPNSNSILLIVEVLPLLKIIRLNTFHRYIEQTLTNFEVSHTQKTIIWLIILTALLFHWSSCLSYAFPYIVMHVVKETVEDSDAYLIKIKLYEKSEWMIYLTCLHVGVSNFFGSSFIEFQSFNKSDKAIRCILLLFGKGYMIYIIVTILQLMESMAESQLKYQEVEQQVNKYIHRNKLSENLRNKLTAYYEYRFQGNYFKEHTISSHLNKEIAIYCSQGLLETATILHNLPRSVLENLIAALQPVIYLEKDIIYTCNTEGDCMYFIASGTVALITFSGKEVCHLQDGAYFGAEVLIYPGQRRIESVVALEVCELLRLDKLDFKRIVMPKSDLYKRMVKVVKKQIEDYERLETAHPP